MIRLKIEDQTYYVLETAVIASEVCMEQDGVECSDYPNDTIAYHWSGKHKKFLYGPKPLSRNPAIRCAVNGCLHAGNRSCDMHFCSRHCLTRNDRDIKSGKL